MNTVITTWRDFVGPHPLQTLIPDNYGRLGRGDLRGYEILFHEPDRTLFVRTYKGLCEIPYAPESDLPYIFWSVGKLLEHLLENEKWLEKRGAENIARIKESTAERLTELEHQNEAFKLLFAQQSEVETGSQEDLQLKIEALKASRAADKAGFEAVIRELRAEVARLKSSAPVAAPVRLTDGDMLDSLNETAIAKQAACGYPSMRNLLDMARAIESAALRANGFKVEGEQ